MTKPPFPACNQRYRAAHDSGPRSAHDVNYIVLHSTESSGTAASVARFFSTPAASGSAHLVIDDKMCYRCVPDLVTPWAAPPCNTSGFHIEHVGFAAWGKDRWLAHLPMLERSAYKASLRCRTFKIKPRVLTDAQLRDGKVGGIVTHAQVSRVFHKSDHTDPGAGFPLPFYVSRVASYLAVWT